MTTHTPPSPSRRRRVRTPLAGVACLLLGAGCATVQQPPAADPVADIDVADVQRAPPAAPATVRWGGTIARVTNTDAGTTDLEIVARPLAGSGRPRHVDASAGRFVAEVDRFLDPEIVREGRDVTVTGAVAGLRDGKVGEADYRFPVVAVENLRYWKPAARRSAAAGAYGPYGPYGPYGYAPYGAYPAYGPWGPVPYGYAYDPFDFDRRFWHDFYHDPIRRPGHSRGGRVGVGVTVRP